MSKNKGNKGQMAVKIIAGFLAAIFILVASGTLIYYIFM